MLDQSFSEVYTKFKLQFYKKIFGNLETRDPSLTVMEIFCVEVIYALHNPTINEFATFTHISGPNATYKVNSLVRKGYVRKIQSQLDKREYFLQITDKYMTDYGITYDYIRVVVERMKANFTEEEIIMLERMLMTMNNELMPEAAITRKI